MKTDSILRVLIVDDEPEARKAIEILLNDFANIVICESTGNVQLIPEIMKRENPDVIILDIQMPEMDGFMVLQDLRDRLFDPIIIFTTAYDQYALKALKAGAFEYLLKPVNRDELRQVIGKAAQKSEEKKIEKRISKIEETLTQSTSRIRFNTRSGLILIHPADILFIEADANYSEIHLSTLKQEIVSMNLGEVMKLLPGQFIRINRSVIVNGSYITRVSGSSRLCHLKHGSNEYSFKIPEKQITEIRQVFSN